jgi:hypothetical protein
MAIFPGGSSVARYGRIPNARERATVSRDRARQIAFVGIFGLEVVAAARLARGRFVRVEIRSAGILAICSYGNAPRNRTSPVALRRDVRRRVPRGRSSLDALRGVARHAMGVRRFWSRFAGEQFGARALRREARAGSAKIVE